MINEFAAIYKRELETLRNEISTFVSEEKLWELRGDIKNTAGNLALHLIGNLNHFIGAGMKQTDYQRNREAEFSEKNTPRKMLLHETGLLLSWLPSFLESQNDDFLLQECKVEFAGKRQNNFFMLIHLLAHFNYHLGQINYLRRML